MNFPEPPSEERIRHVVDLFWDTIPAYWHRIRAHIRQTAEEQFELSVEQFHVLRLIRRGHTSVSKLAQVRHISRPAASQAVNILVARALVTRRRDATDRRYIHLALTASGNALLDDILEDTRCRMIQSLAELSLAELAALQQAFEILNKIETG